MGSWSASTHASENLHRFCSRSLPPVSMWGAVEIRNRPSIPLTLQIRQPSLLRSGHLQCLLPLQSELLQPPAKRRSLGVILPVLGARSPGFPPTAFNRRLLWTRSTRSENTHLTPSGRENHWLLLGPLLRATPFRQTLGPTNLLGEQTESYKCS